LLTGNGNVSRIDATTGVNIFSEVRYANRLECLLPNEGNIGRVDSSTSIHIAEERTLRRGEVSFICLHNARNVTVKPWFTPELHQGSSTQKCNKTHFATSIG